MKHEDLVIKPKKPKGEDGYKVFSVRMKEDVVARIDDISSKTGYSRNELIAIFIEYALDRCIIDTSEMNE